MIPPSERVGHRTTKTVEAALYWADGQPVQSRMSGRPDDYRSAVAGNGPHAAEWQDKPHRLVYDLAGEVLRLEAQLSAVRQEHRTTREEEL